MALNPSVFKTRAVSAVFFVLLMLAGLLINEWLFVILFGFIMGGCLVEFFRIMKLIAGKKYLIAFPVSLIYIIMPLLMMMDLGIHVRKIETAYYFMLDPLFPCAVIFAVWINDTMAYITGSIFGKTPFSKISPKKTWEGTIGGILLCIICISILGLLPAARHIPMYHWSMLAAIVAVTGTAGDLFESKLKRLAGIKDSGSIMPGHGGFLDRFDSLLVALPFAWIYVRFLIFPLP